MSEKEDGRITINFIRISPQDIETMKTKKF